MFASKEGLNQLVMAQIHSGKGLEKLDGLYPFLSKQTLRSLAEYLLKNRNLGNLSSLTPFL